MNLNLETPNSKLYFTVSTKVFKRADDSRDENYIIPDIEGDVKEALEECYDLIYKDN